MKWYIVLVLWFACGFISCYDDKGNYDYREVDELTITGIPEDAISALYKAENLVLSPTVTSKFEGEISADDPNYEFAYYYDKNSSEEYLIASLLDSSKVKDLNIPAEITPGTYTAWFKVKDLRTNVVTSAEFKMEIITSTTKGWLVLCEEGVDRKVRVDMIGEVGSQIVTSKDVLDFLPESHGAFQLYMESNMVYTGNNPYLNIYTEEGSFRVYSKGGDFIRTSYGDPRSDEFIRVISDIIAVEDANYSNLVITTDGDVYQRRGSNSVYDVKINVDVPLTEPTYKMAPFVGVCWGTNAYNGVLYDQTNKKFKYFLSYAYGMVNGEKYLFDPTEPAPNMKYFDWKTGKDMVYMSGTAQGNRVYALMKDVSGKYSIYGITTGQYRASVTQYVARDNIEAPGLSSATCYAFHPTLPFLFYDSGNEVYLYDMSTQSAQRVVTLGVREKISMLKFNKLRGGGHNDTSVAQLQYKLGVGSIAADAEVGNEGILRFYDVPEFADVLTQYGVTYTGFGVIKDIAYKER